MELVEARIWLGIADLADLFHYAAAGTRGPRILAPLDCPLKLGDQVVQRPEAGRTARPARALERRRQAEVQTISPVVADAIARGEVRLECQMLPHAYLHLLPLVGTA
jgi:hypothetical protein